jgi:hypothetical protein
MAMLCAIMSWLDHQPEWLAWSLFIGVQFTPALLAQVLLHDKEMRVNMWVFCLVATAGCGLALPFMFIFVIWAYFEERSDRKNKGVM